MARVDQVVGPVDQLSSHVWGLVVTQGVIAILAGIVLLFWPGLTAAFVAVLLGLFVLVWGIVGLVRSLIGMGRLNLWWVELLFSVFLVGAGVYLLRNPDVTLSLVILLVGLVFVVRGVVDVVEGLFSRDTDVRQTRVLYLLLGVLGVAAGVFTLAYPASAGLAFLWVVGLYAVLYGSVSLAIALRTRDLVA